MTKAINSQQELSNWIEWIINDPNAPVALQMKQKLVSVDGGNSVIFPPTYADIGYVIDELSGGESIALIDSVGSQANRIEPIFKVAPYSDLVPQIEIDVSSKAQSKDKGTKPEKRLSILDLPHRIADAAVKYSPGLVKKVECAFLQLKNEGNAYQICCMAPTSLVFGVWDSRGTGERLPRLIRSIIRAFNVSKLKSAAQFVSIYKHLDSEHKAELEGIKKGIKLSEYGLNDAPSTNALGGVYSPENMGIERDVSVNLVALRRLQGENKEQSMQIQKYILSLTLISATSEFDLYLREGCNLRVADDNDLWHEVPRRGEATQIQFGAEFQNDLLHFAQESLKPFKHKWLDQLIYEFDSKYAAEMIKADKKKGTESD